MAATLEVLEANGYRNCEILTEGFVANSLNDNYIRINANVTTFPGYERPRFQVVIETATQNQINDFAAFIYQSSLDVRQSIAKLGYMMDHNLQIAIPVMIDNKEDRTYLKPLFPGDPVFESMFGLLNQLSEVKYFTFEG